jgi:putative transcriptional regulator
MDVKWRLRIAAAQREVWTGAQLRRLLAERAGLQISSASVSALLTKTPAQVKPRCAPRWSAGQAT